MTAYIELEPRIDDLKNLDYDPWIHTQEAAAIRELESNGHSFHCACRQLWGDGECECDLYQVGYDPYWWM